MSEKNIQKIIEVLNDQLVAVYSYEIKKGSIPIFVMKHVDFSVLQSYKKHFQNEKFIMLTQDEIDNGCDVFPLKFLHMKNHSTLVFGSDVFSSIKIEKSDLKHILELHLRTKMVQLREDFLSTSVDVFVEEILYFIHVMWEGILYLEGKKSDKKDLAKQIEQYVKCDGKIVTYLYTHKAKSLDAVQLLDVVTGINSYLKCLCDKIDIFKL